MILLFKEGLSTENADVDEFAVGNARLINQKVFHCMKCQQLTCGQCLNGKKKQRVKENREISIRPAIFDITGDPKKTEAADLAQAS
ncbi:hypothetical protein T12_16903 [Trichinella patagoniensis]|uniref:Uncharacterized protein n=1 Tax=Trichinella patagoniensis TaxID=990121 RepID=A0A0V0ZUA9_9BILA|nr:hypothetical protein T12_16903 [Trichinella patagoniensis]